MTPLPQQAMRDAHWVPIPPGSFVSGDARSSEGALGLRGGRLSLQHAPDCTAAAAGSGQRQEPRVARLRRGVLRSPELLAQRRVLRAQRREVQLRSLRVVMITSSEFQEMSQLMHCLCFRHNAVSSSTFTGADWPGPVLQVMPHSRRKLRFRL